MRFLSIVCFATTIVALPAAGLAAADKYSITPQEHAACDGDAERLCLAAYPDEEKMLSCMATKRSQLNPLCLATFEAGVKKRHLKI